MSETLRLRKCNHYLDRIAPTPLVPVRLDPAGSTVWCKLEFMNPSGSTKDRIANFILAKALRRGDMRPGNTRCRSPIDPRGLFRPAQLGPQLPGRRDRVKATSTGRPNRHCLSRPDGTLLFHRAVSTTLNSPSYLS